MWPFAGEAFAFDLLGVALDVSLLLLFEHVFVVLHKVVWVNGLIVNAFHGEE